MCSFTRSIVIAAALVSLGAISNLSAQFEPRSSALPAKTEQAPPAKTEQAPPAKTEQAPPAKTEQAAKDDIQKLVRETVATELKGVEYAPVDHNHGNMVYVALGLALIAFVLVFFFRRSLNNVLACKLDSKSFDDWIKSVYQPGMAGLTKRLKALEPPDPKEQAQAEVESIQAELNQAVKDEKFAEAGELSTKLKAAREKLAGLMKAGATVALLLIVLFATAGIASAQTCYNTLTGKTPNSVRQAIAVVGVSNEFVCSGSGAVEITKLDGSSLITPTVTKTNPLSFEFTPTAPGRAIIKIAGRVVSALAIVADNDQAFLVGSAIDLAASRVSSLDSTARAAAKKAMDAVSDLGTRFGTRLDTTQTAVASLDDRMKQIAASNATMSDRVKALEAKPAYNDTLIKAELAAARVRIEQLTEAVGLLKTNGEAMAVDITAVNTKADQALAAATTLRSVLLSKGSRGVKKALK